MWGFLKNSYTLWLVVTYLFNTLSNRIYGREFSDDTLVLGYFTIVVLFLAIQAIRHYQIEQKFETLQNKGLVSALLVVGLILIVCALLGLLLLFNISYDALPITQYWFVPYIIVFTADMFRIYIKLRARNNMYKP